MTPSAVTAALDALGARYALPPAATDRLASLLTLISEERSSITSVRDPEVAIDVHVADSLSGLTLDVVRRAQRIADLGSGGGFPGLVLAIALLCARVALVESVARKASFLETAVGRLQLDNVTVIVDRAETWTAGRRVHDVVTARALAPLPVLLEYATPLLASGGALVAWKSGMDEAERADGEAAARHLGMSQPQAHRVEPYRGARDRSLVVSTKVGSTPNRYPRRPGMARKRPLGVHRGGESSSPANL